MSYLIVLSLVGFEDIDASATTLQHHSIVQTPSILTAMSTHTSPEKEQYGVLPRIGIPTGGSELCLLIRLILAIV